MLRLQLTLQDDTGRTLAWESEEVTADEVNDYLILSRVVTRLVATLHEAWTEEGS